LLVAAAGWQGAIGGNGRIAGTNANEDITLLFGAISLDGSFNRGGDVIRFSGGVEEYVIGRSSASTAILTDNDSVLASIPIGTAGLSIGFADAARRLVFESSEYLLGDQLFGTDSAPVQPQVGDSPLATGNNTTAAGRLVLIGTNVEVTIGGDVLISGTNNVDLITLDASGGTITFDGSFNRGGDIIVLTGAAADYTAVRQGSSSIIIEGEGSKLSIPIGLSGLILRFADGDRTMVFEGGQYLIGNQAITTTPVQLNAVPPSSSIMPSAEAQDMMALEALLMDSVYTPSISPDYLMIA
jgi:hypothetical protein